MELFRITYQFVYYEGRVSYRMNYSKKKYKTIIDALKAISDLKKLNPDNYWPFKETSGKKEVYSRVGNFRIEHYYNSLFKNTDV